MVSCVSTLFLANVDGQSLLSFVEANELDEYEAARATGYVNTTGKGAERVLINKFLQLC